VIYIKKLFFIFIIVILVVGLSGVSVYLIDMFDQDILTTSSSQISSTTNTISSSSSDSITTTTTVVNTIDNSLLTKMSLANVMVTTVYKTCDELDNCTVWTSEQGSGTIYKIRDKTCVVNTCIAPIYYVITNFHVISDPEYSSISTDVITSITMFDGTTYQATYDAGNPEYDLALLSFSRSQKIGQSIDFLTERNPVPGDEVLTIGCPGGVYNTVTQGEFDRFSAIDSYWYDLILHSAILSPGSSGGALYSSTGQFLGINSFSNENGYYSIPWYVVNNFLASVSS
jgi:S1-C subfamily serine protease